MKPIKTILVNPLVTAEVQAGSLKEVANIILPLGIGYVAAVLEKNDFDVKIIDCMPLQLNVEELKSKLLEENPDIIGFTATIISIKSAIQTAEQLKPNFPNAVFVLGGPQLAALPQQIFEKHSVFDLGVLGEGEETTLELVQSLSEEKFEPEKIKGLIHRKDGKVIINERRPPIMDLDALPFPARHLFPPLKLYKPNPQGYKRLPFTHILTSRGCPYQCIYCDKGVLGSKVRLRSSQNVLDEIGMLIKDYGIKEIKFFDDLFTFDKKRVIELCKGMRERNYDITWSCSTRVDRVDPKLLKEMNLAGCWQIDYGIESGDQGILNIIKKGITVEQSRNAVRWTKEAGIQARAYFVLGFPGETAETIRKTINFAKELDLDYATFYALMVYPGNEMYEIIKKEGKLLHEDYEQFTAVIDVNKTRLHYVPEGMTEEEVKKLVRRAYKEFYLRPSFIIKKIFSIRSWNDIKYKYWTGFKALIRM